jgi:Family of unknown function (DUF6533)
MLRVSTAHAFFHKCRSVWILTSRDCVSQVAVCSWLIYDHLLNANHELQLVWRAPNGITKWGFLIYRYVAPISMTLFAYGRASWFSHLDN